MCDGALPDFGGQPVWRTARKAHRCDECRQPILPGQAYEYARGRWDGIWGTFRTCCGCIMARNAYFAGDCFLYRDLWETEFACLWYPEKCR